MYGKYSVCDKIMVYEPFVFLAITYQQSAINNDNFLQIFGGT